MRKFEKISFDEFKKSISDDKNMYKQYSVPKRHTTYGAGYDFELLEDMTIKPGEVKKLPTGIKVQMNEDEALFIVVRSSTGIKYNIRLTNQVAVADKDYYNNESNEGHIFISIQNQSENEYSFEKGDRLVQGIFMKYLITDDDEITEVRKGGIGSTNKGDEKNGK